LFVNRFGGDDVGIALDYSLDISKPRVIGNSWHIKGVSGCEYLQISDSFEDFVELMKIDSAPFSCD